MWHDNGVVYASYMHRSVEIPTIGMTMSLTQVQPEALELQDPLGSQVEYFQTHMRAILLSSHHVLVSS